MGQQQSSNGEQSVVKRSYYDLLGIPKTSSEDEIKKAYRRKALDYHPDRNYGNVEEATRLFAEVQTAYEVLSDPQERAWYDSHESAMLSGQDAKAGFHTSVAVTTSEDIAKLYANFTGRNDFSDSSSGFFSSLRDTFDKLAREEALASENEDLDAVDLPSFGTSEDDYYRVVKPFYDTWSSFSTRKSFAWKDVYRLSEAPDRRVRRAMEKENKRFRDEAIKDFNDTVKILVAFVKKRDPRQKTSQLTEEQRQQTLRDQAAAQAAKARAANHASLENRIVPEWVITQDSGDEAPEEFWDEAREEPEEHFECVVCDKVFKSEKQYGAHERSKKHIQGVKRIQHQMRKEGISFGLDSQTALGPGKEISHVVNNSAVDQASSENISGETSNIVRRNSSASSANFNVKGGGNSSSVQADSDDGDDDYAPRDAVSERLAGAESLYTVSSDGENDKEPEKFKVGKAKAKRAKRASRAATGVTQTIRWSCIVCSNEFPSKNQLFAHLKRNPSHAQPTVNEAGKSDKRRRK